MPRRWCVIVRWTRRYGLDWTRHSLQMLVILLLHMITIPQLLTVLWMITDEMPSLDIALLAWGGLAALYVQHLIQRNQLLMFANSAGFFAQAMLCAMVFFQRG